MRVSVASLLACVYLAVVHAQTDANATTTQPLVFNRADVVQEIVMGDEPNDQPKLIQATDGDAFNPSVGNPLTGEVHSPFIETIRVHRPFDELIVTTPDVGPIQIVRVKNGKKSKSPRKPLLAPQNEYIYGEFMILRLRTIANELVQSIRASPEQPEENGIVLTHTVSNTKVDSKSTTNGWESEATVTARAEASGDLFGFGVGASREFSATVRRSVSTTFASSEATTVTKAKETKFTLRAPAGHIAALWMSTTQLDVFVCKARTNKIRTEPIDSNCHFSHSVTEDGKRYEVTLTDMSQ